MACRQRLCPQWEELSPEEGEKEEEGYEEKGLRGRGRGGRCRGKLQPLVAAVMHSNITAEEANEGGQSLEHSAADRQRRESQTLLGKEQSGAPPAGLRPLSGETGDLTSPPFGPRAR